MKPLTDEEIIRLLPERPDGEVIMEARKLDIGEELCIYHRESIGGYFDPIEGDIAKKPSWGAICDCTVCGNRFITGWSDGDILLTVGEDGMTYEGWTGAGWEGVTAFGEDEFIICPNCYVEVRLIKKASLRGGRTYQQMLTSMRIIRSHFTLITWIVSRHLDEHGTSVTSVRPREAAVLMPNGSLRSFSRIKQGQFISCERDMGCWSRVKKATDPMQRVYYNYDAINHKQFGGGLILTGEDFAGTTAEKTGLAEYLQAGGDWPYVYLRFWRQHRTVENLLKSGMHELVVDEIGRAMERAINQHSSHTLPCYAQTALSCVAFSKAKPHEMLGMTKTEYRDAIAHSWTGEQLQCWQSYRYDVEYISPADFRLDIDLYGESNVFELTDDFICGESYLRLSDIVRYARRQNAAAPELAARLYIDYHKMLQQLDIRELSEEEMYPRDLTAAHDRIADILSSRQDKKNDANFQRLREEYKALEWTDGELCIVMPSCNDDLINEGRTLRHCVGSYGQSHLTGKPIFFVRHYRRPERSYYTLNENLTGAEPHRIQLHGYGNESHGKHKEYRHKIPKNVLDFVDRWEREILAPWYAQRQAEKQNKKKKEKAA